MEGGSRIYLRRHKETDEEETILEISFQHYQIHAMSLSVDESMMAYLVGSANDPTHKTIKIRDLQSSREIVFPATRDQYIVSVEFGPIQDSGGHSLFYTTQNHVHRPNTVYVCCVSRDLELSRAVVVYSNDDNAVMVEIQRTKGCRYVAIAARTKTSNEISLVGSITKNPILVRRRQPGVQYHCECGANNDVWILAHASEPYHASGLGEEITAFETTIEALPLRDTFGTLRAASGDFIIYDIELFRTYIVYYQRSSIDGRERMRIDCRETGASRIVEVPGDNCSSLSPGGNICFDASSLRFEVDNCFTVGYVYEHYFETGATIQLGPAPPDRNQQFMQQRFLVESYDGTNVPLTLVHSRVIDPLGSDFFPVVVHGYGAYGEPVIRGFDAVTVSLLNRGFVIAFAHTRGGGELGRAWYRAGRLHEKRNSIRDFVACTEWLIEHVTAPSVLTAKAFSAGGVVVGAVINERPELFGTAVLTNAFLDVTSSTWDPQQPLTEHEYEEWGNPSIDTKVARLIASYCPYSNIQQSSVSPRVLVIGTLDDLNVPFSHAVTYQRKYQRFHNQSGNEKALLFTVPSGGHHLFGARLDVACIEAAFIVESTLKAKAKPL